MTIDTLKQAAQALRDEADDRLDFVGDEYRKLAAALEAMAEQQLEHDAQVRDAALEQAATIADRWASPAQRLFGNGGPAAAIRAFKSTGGAA